MQLANVDAAVPLLVVDDLDAELLVLGHQFVKLLALAVELLLDGIAAGRFLLEAQIERAVLLGYVGALLRQLFEFLLAVLDVGVGFHVVHLVLLIELVILVGDLYQLARGASRNLRERLDF